MARKVQTDKMSKKQIKYPKGIYFSPTQTTSYSSPITLYEWTGEKKGETQFKFKANQKLLSQQESYVISKVRKDTFDKPSIPTYFKYQLLQRDLMFMGSYAEDNGGIKYLLMHIDSFGCYLWVRGIKNKKGQTVSTAFRNIWQDIDHPVLFIYWDMRSEYKSQQFQALMKEYNIHHYFSTTGSASQIERVHRT